MSRTANEIRESMISTSEDQDNTIDVRTGPIYDSVIVPTSSELALVESEVENVNLLYSTEFIRVATDTQVNAYLNNFAKRLGKGEKANGFIYFYTRTRLQAGDVLTIPVGTLLANRDRSLIYRVIEERVVLGENISNYFNSSKGWYEIAVPIEADKEGTQYNLPAKRITQLLTSIEFVDGIEQRDFIDGGISAEDLTKKYQRIINAFQGQDKGSHGGILSLIDEVSEAVTNAVVITSNERTLFTRFVPKLGLDIYVNGSKSGSAPIQETTILQNTNNVILELQPVLTISQVLVNGVVTTDYVLEKDVEIYADSVRASDRVRFGTILPANTVVNITYTYNKLLHDVNDAYFTDQSGELFDMDVLVRRVKDYYLTINAVITTGTLKNREATLEAVQNAIFELVETNELGPTYIPEVLRQQVRAKVPALKDIIFETFTLTDFSTLAVETIELPKNARGLIDVDSFSVR